MLGSRGGVLAVAFYLAEGVVGFPVFAAYSSGIKVILGPTGGYLLGFIPAAYVTGRLLEKIQKERIFQIFLAGLAGELVLFAVGYLQLAYFCGVSKAYVYGVAPFLLGDLLKLIAFSLLVRKK
jgi:biotin transport system substrate-specific component